MRKQLLTLGKDAMIYGVGSVLTRFLNLLTLPIFARYLSPEEYGALTMLAILTMVAQPIFSLGLGAAMGPSYFAKSTEDNKLRVVWTAFAINFVSAGIMGAIGWIFPAILCSLVLLPVEYSMLVSLTLTGCALTVMSTALMQRVQFERQSKIFVLVSFVTAIATIAFSILTVVFWSWGLDGMVYGQLLGNAVTFLCFLAITVAAGKPGFDCSLGRELFRAGVPLIPSFAFLFVIAQANKYILERESGLDSVGIYALGFNFGAVMNIVVNGIMTAWYPFFISYVKRQEEARILFGKIFTYYVLGGGVFVISFFLFAQPVVDLLLPGQYAAAAQVIGCVAAGHYFVGVFNMLLPPAHFKRDFSSIVLSQFIASVISLVAYFVLIHFWGLVGAGLSFMVGHALMAFVLHLSNRRFCESGFVILFEVRKLASFALIAILSVALYQVSYFWRLDRFSLLQEFLFSLACTLVFLSSTYFYVIGNEEKAQLKSLATRLRGGGNDAGQGLR